MAKEGSKGRQSGASRGLRRQSSTIADWASASADAIRDAIERAAFTGGALRFGYSRDGGAYAIGIYGDGDPYTVWVKPDDDVDSYLVDIKELFQTIADEQAEERTSKKPPPRST